MKCWAKSGQNDAGEKALALLRALQSLWKQGDPTMRPNAISYNTVMSAYANKGQAAESGAILEEMYLDYPTNGNKSAKPDVTCSNIIMNSWAESGQKNTGEKSLALLQKLQSLWKQGDPTLRLKVIICNMVMSAYAKQGQAAEAGALLEEMYLDYSANGSKSSKPTLTSYNIVMKSWAESGQTDAGEKSLALLRKLQSLWKQGDPTMRPNVISYNTVMSVYAKRGRAAEAEALLEEMYLGYTTNGNSSAKPDVTC
jgi:pentatricopeptide repeat protein